MTVTTRDGVETYETSCIWCGKAIIKSSPPQPTDTKRKFVERMSGACICHSCVKHLAVVVIGQENAEERAAQREAEIAGGENDN